MADYPTTVPSFSSFNDGDVIQDEHIEDAYDEIAAIGAGLLNGLEHPLRLAAATEYTIAAGVITPEKGFIKIDTEGNAAADDLDTITPGANVGEGSILVCRAENVARVVTLKDGSGNLLLQGDCALDATDKTITLIYDGTNWREIARSGGVVVGSWTPAIGGVGGASGQAYSVQAGRYVKIGQMVFVQGRITLSTLGTITTQAQITGLPFTIENVSNIFAGLNVHFWAAMTGNLIDLSGIGSPNTTVVPLYRLTAAATGKSALVQADMSNTTDLIFSMAYRAAS